MESTIRKNKGGRPPKEIKRNVKLSAHCSILEATIIEGRSKKANLSISEFIRTQAISGTIVIKTYPKEILQVSNMLSQIAANTHGIVKKLNYNQLLDFYDLEVLSKLSEEFKNLSSYIKESLK
jgi:hypothetical protein